MRDVFMEEKENQRSKNNRDDDRIVNRLIGKGIIAFGKRHDLAYLLRARRDAGFDSPARFMKAMQRVTFRRQKGRNADGSYKLGTFTKSKTYA